VNAAEQLIFEEYLRWRSHEGAEALEVKMMFHAHLKKERANLLAALRLSPSRQYQEIARLVQTWERKRS